MKNARIVHLIPYDGIGGVEVAARSLEDGLYDGIEFSKYYLVQKEGITIPARSGLKVFHSENDPRAYIAAIRSLIAIKPDLLIGSLWRSCVVLIIVKLLQRDTKIVTFLHLASDVHWPDRLLNRLAMRLSTEIWADSQTTLDARVPGALRARGRVISFLVERQPEPKFRKPLPRFIFWGRLHPQKDLARALRFFSNFRSQVPDATFHLIGPDGGERNLLEQEVKCLGLDGSVFFLGPMERASIFEFAAECSFYLQMSVDEGMAMSVIEAMQLGLVPVVTPVGEIGRYCQDSVNAILVIDDLDAVERVTSVFKQETRYRSMARAAVSTWQEQPLYRNDILAACDRLIKRSN
jgi:glycosyltransferase involved in cell wall biosynthesis